MQVWLMGEFHGKGPAGWQGLCLWSRRFLTLPTLAHRDSAERQDGVRPGWLGLWPVVD